METKFIKPRQAFELKIDEGFVVCGDVHLYNAYAYNSGYDGVYSNRLLDIYETLFKACLNAKRLKLPMVINGDLINTGIFDYPVESLLTKLLLEFRDLDIFINLGNHDLDGDNSVIQPLIDISRSKYHKVISIPHDITYNKTRYIFIPFMNDEDTNKYLDSLKKTKQKTIIFIHNSFMGSSYANKIKSKSGISQTVFTKGKLKWVDMVVASHIHKYQNLCDGKGFYTSSLIPVDFGERRREHGYHIIDVKKNIRYFVIPNAPRFVYIDADEHYDDKTFKRKVNGNIIKILHDKNKTINKEKVKARAVESGALFVAFKSKDSSFKLNRKKSIKGKINGIDAIISSFTSLLAEKYDLEKGRLEKIGLEILEKSRKKSGIKTQRR